MPASIIALLTALLYGVVFMGQFPNTRLSLSNRCSLLLLVPALIFHSLLLHSWIISFNGENFSLLYMFSLTLCLVIFFSCIFSLFEQARGIWLLSLPLGALSLIGAHFFAGEFIVQLSKSPGILVHIITAIISYSILGFAALHAIMLLVFDNLLRKHNILVVANYFPPLQTLEFWLVRLLIIGFSLLTASLLSGWFYLDDMFAQHQVHKTILALLAWLVFASFLLLHQLYGLRGRVASIWTLSAFTLLMLSYFGSKFVKEIILN